jgi:hypothetical protein
MEMCKKSPQLSAYVPVDTELEHRDKLQAP